MDSFYIVLAQLIQFAIILFVGYIAAKLHIISEEMLPGLSKIISKVLLPMYIFINIARDGDAQKLFQSIDMLWWTVIFYAILAIAAKICAVAMHLEREHGNVFQALHVFGMIGFIGIPLIFALYPEEGPMYIAWFTIIDQPFLWTYGIYLTSGEKKVDFKKFINISIVSVLLAMLVVLLSIPLPQVLKNTLDMAGSASIPLCMVYLGAMIHYAKPFQKIKSYDLFVGMFVKMLVIPVVFGRVVAMIGVDETIAGIVVILLSLPAMTVIPMFVPEKSKEKGFAVGACLLMIVVSLFTIPIVQFLVQV